MNSKMETNVLNAIDGCEIVTYEMITMPLYFECKLIVFGVQIPRYIITLHEILAHTPHEHVERRSLENARVQLEHLSRQMHDEVCVCSLLYQQISATSGSFK